MLVLDSDVWRQLIRSFTWLEICQQWTFSSSLHYRLQLKHITYWYIDNARYAPNTLQIENSQAFNWWFCYFGNFCHVKYKMKGHGLIKIRFPLTSSAKVEIKKVVYWLEYDIIGHTFESINTFNISLYLHLTLYLHTLTTRNV